MTQVGFFLKYVECLYFFLLLQDENIFFKDGVQNFTYNFTLAFPLLKIVVLWSLWVAVREIKLNTEA